MASYLKQEDEYIPWKAVLQKMTFVKRVLSRTPEYGRFKVRQYDFVEKRDVMT